MSFRVVDRFEAARIASMAGGKKQQRTARPPKYRNEPVVVDGVRFASKLEAARYGELKILLRRGEIAQLQLHPSYPLVVKGTKVADYVADFAYVLLATGERITEDCKGHATPVYKLKKKLMKAIYGIEIKEIRK